MMPRMRFFYYLGGFLLMLAFAGAAAEAIPRSLPGGAASGGWYVSAYELWYAIMPGNLVVTQIQVEKISPALWDPLLVGLSLLPAWLLFGLPGGVLAWFNRPNKEMTAEQLEEMKKHEESLFLFDDLAKEAREAGYDTDEANQAAANYNYKNMEILETEGGATPYSADQVIDDLDFDGPDGAGPDGKG